MRCWMKRKSNIYKIIKIVKNRSFNRLSAKNMSIWISKYQIILYYCISKQFACYLCVLVYYMISSVQFTCVIKFSNCNFPPCHSLKSNKQKIQINQWFNFRRYHIIPIWNGFIICTCNLITNPSLVFKHTQCEIEKTLILICFTSSGFSLFIYCTW